MKEFGEEKIRHKEPTNTAEASATELREGDVYRWRYIEGDDGGRPWGRYHCKSQIGIVSNGRLVDTYWCSGSDVKFGADDLHHLKLTFLGNLNDLEKRNEGDRDYYDDADIVNLNHPNSTRGNFYIRKGAKRSAAKMLESAKHLLEHSESDMRCAERTKERALASIAKIESGDTSGYIG